MFCSEPYYCSIFTGETRSGQTILSIRTNRFSSPLTQKIVHSRIIIITTKSTVIVIIIIVGVVRNNHPTNSNQTSGTEGKLSMEDNRRGSLVEMNRQGGFYCRGRYYDMTKKMQVAQCFLELYRESHPTNWSAYYDSINRDFKMDFGWLWSNQYCPTGFWSVLSILGNFPQWLSVLKQYCHFGAHSWWHLGYEADGRQSEQPYKSSNNHLSYISLFPSQICSGRSNKMDVICSIHSIKCNT